MPVKVDRSIKKHATKIRSLERKVRSLEKQNEVLVKHVTRLVSIISENQRTARANRSALKRLLPFREPVHALIQSVKMKQRVSDFSKWKSWMASRLAKGEGAATRRKKAGS